MQSVALKIVCDRQAEIDAFVARSTGSSAPASKAAATARSSPGCTVVDGKKAEVGNAASGRAIESELGPASSGSPTRSSARSRSSGRRRRSSPAASSRKRRAASASPSSARWASRRGSTRAATIGDRGQLGLITYMRTDSTRVADEAIDAVRELIAATYGARTLPEKPNVYASKKGAQDAHEAIRPTTFDLPPDVAAPLPASRTS